MSRTPETIAKEIFNLVSELATLAGASTNNVPTKLGNSASPSNETYSGPKGGIRALIEDGKLNSPKQLPEVVEFLKQEGRHYSDQAVSMGLLRLVKERLLTRLRDTEDKKWKYVIRR